VTQRLGSGIALLFHDGGTRRRRVVSSMPRPPLPLGKTRYPLYRRLGGPQGRSGQVRKISSPPGFDPQSIQSVVSRYTDWATQPTYTHIVHFNIYQQASNPENRAMNTPSSINLYFIKQGISWLVEELLTSQEGICCKQFVSYCNSTRLGDTALRSIWETANNCQAGDTLSSRHVMLREQLGYLT
jgi:hypothetical protein